jgi:glycosidase
MESTNWAQTAFFYQIYPLGLLGAARHNQFQHGAQDQFHRLIPWLDHICNLGANAVYLGPIFESNSHGYDTVDYFQIDRRLGTNAGMKDFYDAAHKRGLKIVLDGVFNHCGRSFWAFRDVQQHGARSAHADWIQGLDFSRPNSAGDPFSYQNWGGHDSLVKFNLANPGIRAHLFEAVRTWMSEWEIDGLRLDAADCVRPDFWRELREITARINPNFWLMGEIVQGDYRKWIQEGHLDSVTNYECYKGLYSSFNDQNFFEIAYSLNRQFGNQGIYRNLWLYNFVDNHDVSRIASQLKQKKHLYPLYGLLFTIPGIPSLYYGSEFGIPGIKRPDSDLELRPALDLEHCRSHPAEADLLLAIKKLAALRKQTPALVLGSYEQAFVNSKQFAFWRNRENQRVLVVVNIDSQAYPLVNFPVNQPVNGFDALENREVHLDPNQRLNLVIPPNWLSVIVFDQAKSNL